MFWLLAFGGFTIALAISHASRVSDRVSESGKPNEDITHKSEAIA
jgi:hypothetical protein